MALTDLPEEDPDEEAPVDVFSGGLGYNYVELVVTSPPNTKLDYGILIFGKKPEGNESTTVFITETTTIQESTTNMWGEQERSGPKRKKYLDIFWINIHCNKIN